MDEIVWEASIGKERTILASVCFLCLFLVLVRRLPDQTEGCILLWRWFFSACIRLSSQVQWHDPLLFHIHRLWLCGLVPGNRRCSLPGGRGCTGWEDLGGNGPGGGYLLSIQGVLRSLLSGREGPCGGSQRRIGGCRFRLQPEVRSGRSSVWWPGRQRRNSLLPWNSGQTEQGCGISGREARYPHRGPGLLWLLVFHSRRSCRPQEWQVQVWPDQGPRWRTAGSGSGWPGWCCGRFGPEGGERWRTAAGP